MPYQLLNTTLLKTQIDDRLVSIMPQNFPIMFLAFLKFFAYYAH